MIDDLTQHLAIAEYERLRARFPHMAKWLELTIQVCKIGGGGYEVWGAIYGTEAEADEARKAAIMQELYRMEDIRL